MSTLVLSVGDVLRSNEGKGAYYATVHAVREGRVWLRYRLGKDRSGRRDRAFSCSLPERFVLSPACGWRLEPR